MSDTEVQEEPIDTAPAEPRGSAAAGETQFNEDITVFLGNPLSHLDKGRVKAYAAQGRGKVQGNHFVYVCEDDLAPRTIKTSNYASIINPSLARLVATGAFYWPPAKGQRYGYVYENNLGRPLMHDDRRGGLGWKAEDVLASVVRPLVGVLMDMRDKDLVHGEIRPGNIFDGGQKKVERAILGECLCLPASAGLPALYETIERGMADPLARGIGSRQDDMYSLGVTLTVLLRSHDPMDGFSDREIVESKMDLGSYNALIGKDRFTGSILELLRGLLYDDAAQRWNLDDVVAWLDGRRLTPKQSAKKIKATRPIVFNGNKYLYPESLGFDLNLNPPEAVQIIDGGEMEQWLQRAIDDKILTSRVEKAVVMAEEGGRSGSYPERLATRLGIALHPDAPIRYKNISVFPEGVGKALAHAYVHKQNIQIFEELINQHFVVQWVDMLVNVMADSSALISRFDSCRHFLRQNQIGYGIERCIYFLSSETPCLSEKTKGYNVKNPEDLLMAFEGVSESPRRPALLFDRHIVAFLSVKDRKNIDPYMPDINGDKPYKRIMGELKTLATIQKRSRMQPFPGIAGWIADNLEPAYERFHDRELRKSLKQKVDKLVPGGDLAKIAALFDNPKVYEEDRREFRRAMHEYLTLERETKTLSLKLEHDPRFGQETGRQVAAFVSGLVSAIIIVITAFVVLTGKVGV